MSIEDSGHYRLLDQLAEEFAARFRRGERPALKEYTDRYPALAQEIRELFPALAKVERAEGLRQGEEESGDSRTVNPPVSQVGDYRILREIGHGGMGVVYEAEQVSLGRRVALKMLPRHVADRPRMLERFRREARAAARLHHTNIVPVFEVGREGDVCYYAMQFIQGQGLDLVYEEIRRLRGRQRDIEKTQSGDTGSSLDWFRAQAEKPTGVAEPSLAEQSGVRQVVRSLLSGRFEVGSGFAVGARATRAEQDRTVEEALSPRPADGPLPLDSGATNPTGKFAMAAPDSPSRSATPDPAASGSSLTSAVMPGGTQISSIESSGSKYARSVARIGLQVALGLAYAHARGVVHRDIKPSNLLLDSDGVVWITDFGLAKSDDDRLTQTGDIVGTLRYMAPERFSGEADARSDIYALGLTLYELLTLEPAFNTRDRLRLIEQVKADDPIAPRLHDRRVPRDLETVILKAIDKDAKRRYATAESMAEDLRRFLDDEPIMARRQTHLERYMRWARRHPVIATLGAAATAVLVLATTASLLVARQMAALADKNERIASSEHAANVTAQLALKKADSSRRETEAQRDRAEGSLYGARIDKAESSLRLYDSKTARALLDQCIPEPGSTDRRGWEWSYLDKWCQPELRNLKVPTTWETNVVAASADGRFLVVGCAAAFSHQTQRKSVVPAYVIDVNDGKVLHELPGNSTFVLAVSFRPDGKRFAIAGNDGTVKVWESDTCRELRNLTGLAATVTSLSWSPDGRRLSTADEYGLVQIWDAETGRETARISHLARHVAWSPDGTRIATAGFGNEVRIWAALNRQPAGPVLNLGGENGIAWAPDGRRLAGIAKDGSLKLWDTQSGQVLFTVPHVGSLVSVAFSPDGSRVASGGTAGNIRLYDSRSGQERAVLFTRYMVVRSLAFSPDGHRLFAVGYGIKAVKIFDADRDPRGRGVTPWLDQLAALAFDGDSDRLHGIAWHGGNLASLSFPSGGMRCDGTFPVIGSKEYPRGDFAFDADGRRLAAPLKRDPAIVGIWDVALGRLAATIRGKASVVTAVAFSPDGLRLATGAIDRPRQTSSATIWDLASLREVLTFDVGPIRVEALAFSSDGRKFAAGGGGFTRDAPGWVTVRNAENGAVVATQDRLGMVKSLAFHPDGASLAIADIWNESVHLLDLVSGTLITRRGPLAVGYVAFTPDGRRLASVGYDATVHIADARTLEQLIVLRSFGEPAGSEGWTPRLAFSADGSRIAAHRSNFLNLWEAGRSLDPQVEPAPDDVAGWLRRSRSFATEGDATQADSAFGRALAIPTDLPEPWIRHGLAEVVEPQQAQMAFARAFRTSCDDPIRWLVCARDLERSDRKHEAGIARAKARAFAEKRLSVAPDDEPAAWVLADLLKDEIADLQDGSWAILVPSELSSARGTTLSRLPDGSILATGEQPYYDSVTLAARTELTGITGLKLEVLPESASPANGPARHYEYADLHLTGWSASVAPGGDRSSARAVVFTEAVATNVRTRDSLAAPTGSNVGNDATLRTWDIRRQFGLRNAIAWTTAGPVDAPAGSTWIIRLDCLDAHWKEGALTRFRLSVTNAPVTLFESALHRALAEPDWNGRTRLGVAHYLQENWQSAAAALRIAADAPEATGTDLFLLALALHHLDRHDEARLRLSSAVEWLNHNKTGGTIRTLVVEAIALIDGITRTQAETRMFLDPLFPADPFAR